MFIELIYGFVTTAIVFRIKNKQLIWRKMCITKLCWIVIGFLILVVIPAQVLASVVYDPNTNTIILKNGTNTLSSIYSEVNNPSVLSYNNLTNTYTLSANITVGEYRGAPAHLVLRDTTLVINSTATNIYTITTYGDLVIDNMIIKSANPSYHWKILAHAYYLQDGKSITNSDISGGHIIFNPTGGYHTPAIPIVIKNNRFHDITIPGEYGKEYILGFRLSSGDNAYLYNNTFENCHITSGGYNGILGFRDGANGVVVDKLYISNCSTNSYGMIFFEGTNSPDNPAVVTNFEIKNVTGYGIIGKEYGNVKFINGIIKNTSEAGIYFYHSEVYGPTKFWIENVTIDGAESGIAGYAEGIADIYNVKINNVYMPYVTDYYGYLIWYITNSKATNYTYREPHKIYRTGEMREYMLTDVYVVDKNGNPVSNATVTVTANEPNVADYSINRNLQPLTQTTTLSNGHTPLPDEDPSNTLALLRLRKNASSEESGFTYTITAEKDGYSNSTIVSPDASWYRSNPNTYQNTITIILPVSLETGNISGIVTDQTNAPIEGVTVTDGIRIAITNSSGSFTISNVPPGNYTLTASKAGYYNSSKSVSVVAGKTITVNFQLTEITSYNITLFKGWNLISLPLKQANTSIAEVLSSINGKYTLVRVYNASDTSDPWKTYNPAIPFANDFDDIDHTMGIYIYMTSNETLTITGEPQNSTNISLTRGWNLVGYPALTARTPAMAFSSISGNYIVKMYDATEGLWKTYDSTNPDGSDLKIIEPGYGYWVYVNDNEVWAVNA